MECLLLLFSQGQRLQEAALQEKELLEKELSFIKEKVRIQLVHLKQDVFN